MTGATTPLAWPVNIIVHFVPLSTLTYRISVVLFVTIFWQSKFCIPNQSFSLFVPSFLLTVSDQTANVALNSNGRYNHYVLITIHNSVYMLMFCFLHSQLHKQISRRSLHVMYSHGRYAVTLQFHTLLHSVLSVTSLPQYPQNKSSCICWGRWGGRQKACLENYENRKFNSIRKSKHYFSVASTPVAATFELYAEPHRVYFSIFMNRLNGRKLFTSIAYLR